MQDRRRPEATGEDETSLMAPKQQRRPQSKGAASSTLPEIKPAAATKQSENGISGRKRSLQPSEIRTVQSQNRRASSAQKLRNAKKDETEQELMRQLDELRTGNVGMVPQKSLNPTDMTKTNVRTLMNRNDSKTSADDLIKDLQENVYKTLNRKRQELDLQRFELKQKRERAQEEELRLRDLICDGTALGLDPDKYIEELQRQAAEEMKKATVKQEEDPTPSGESSRRGHENEEAKEKKKKSSLLNPEKIGMTKRKMKPVKDISTKPVFGNHETLEQKQKEYQKLRKKFEKERQKRQTYNHMNKRLTEEVVQAQKRFLELQDEQEKLQYKITELQNKSITSKEGWGKARARLQELKERSKEEIKLWKHEVKLKEDWVREKEAFDSFVERQIEHAKEMEEEEKQRIQQREEEKKMRKEIEYIREAEATDQREGHLTQKQEEHMRFERCFQRLGLLSSGQQTSQAGTPRKHSQSPSTSASASPSSVSTSAVVPQTEGITVQTVLNLCKRQDDAREDLLNKCEDEEMNISELAQELKTAEKYLHQVREEKEETLSNRYLNELEQQLGSEHKIIDHQKAELEYLYDAVQPVRLGLQHIVSRIMPDWVESSPPVFEERSRSLLYSPAAASTDTYSIPSPGRSSPSPTASQNEETTFFDFEEAVNFAESSDGKLEESARVMNGIVVPKLLEPKEIRRVLSSLRDKLQVIMDYVRRMQALHDPEESAKLGLDIGNQRQSQEGDLSGEVKGAQQGSGHQGADAMGAMFSMQTTLAQNFHLSPHNARIGREDEGEERESDEENMPRELEMPEDETENVLDRNSVKKMSVSILKNAPKDKEDE